MAYRRSIVRAKNIYEQQNRGIPSLSHTWRDDKDDQRLPVTRNLESTDVKNHFTHWFLSSRSIISSSHGPKSVFQDRRFGISISGVVPYSRSFSTGTTGDGNIADKIEILNDVLVDKVADVAPMVSEVTVAAADSFFPVAVTQYLIDYVHVYTGFDWWISIALTTLLVRGVQLPININHLKCTTKAQLLRPKLEAMKRETLRKMDVSQNVSPTAVANDVQTRLRELLKDNSFSLFTPFKEMLASGLFFWSFFFAINNMAKKVPSFEQGGAFWFTDLTTPDTMLILPVLTAFTFWIKVELEAQDYLKGTRNAGEMKNISRVFVLLIIPLTASFPKAMFCYWITSNLFSIAYGLLIKKPEVKKFLGVPIIPVRRKSFSKERN